MTKEQTLAHINTLRNTGRKTLTVGAIQRYCRLSYNQGCQIKEALIEGGLIVASDIAWMYTTTDSFHAKK